MNLKEVLEALVAADGVSGAEGGAAKAVMQMLAPFGWDVTLSHGNVIARIGTHTPEKPTLLLDAHIDQIGMIVTDITDDGFLRVDKIGGLDRRLLPAQFVTVYGKQPLRGVISTIPPHLSKKEDKTVPKLTELAIDTGCTSRAQAEARVSRGDIIRFDAPFASLLHDRVTAAGLDDRCGAAALLQTAELLRGEALSCNVVLLFSTQEELGERGAQIGAYAIAPDYAIAVDVSFGLTEDETPADCGELEKGPMIGISPTLSRGLSDTLIATAKQEKIPYQVEIMPGMTSTNADRFSVCREGAEAGTVSIPLRYMHTPAEVISIADVEQTARLLAAYARRCGQC